MSTDDLDIAACPACGSPIDYCQGHGFSGDPAGAAILIAHDAGDHRYCHEDGCELAGRRDFSAAWVCLDCYLADAYGVTERGGRWFVGESDEPADREPLALLAGFDLTDDTDSNTGDGIDGFSSSACAGCGSTLGGARFRLAVFPRTDLRAVAAEWHGGQGSALYAFTSTGLAWRHADLVAEASACLYDADPGSADAYGLALIILGGEA